MQSNSSTSYKQDIWISKTLSWILRHGALKEGLRLSSDGFIPVEDILNCKALKNKCTLEDIKRVVANNDKQRFSLKTTETNSLEIKANQGHSISDIAHLDLTPIKHAQEFEDVIHGTYFKFWKLIRVQGLHRGRRNHIHFAIGLPENANVISGMRKTVEIYIYIDLAKALAAGLLFFISSNRVILSPGNDQGYIKPEFFLKAIKASNGCVLEI